MRVAVFTMHGLDKVLREGARTRDAHLLEALGRREDVEELIVLDRPPTLPELVSGRRARPEHLAARVRESHFASGKAVTVPLTSRSVIRPLYRRRGWWTSAYDPGVLTRQSIRNARAALHRAESVIAFAPPSVGLWNGCERPTLFDLLDDWTKHPQLGGRCPARYEAIYRSALGAADVCTANSPGTQELAARLGHAAVLLPNAVDRHAFATRAAEHRDHWERRLARYPRPWLLYAGKMQSRLDVPLILEVAARTRGTVLLAGPVLDRRAVRPLLCHERIAALGDVPYLNLPGLMACADVALIPHRVGDGEVGGDPIKVYEYAAAGARIVSTPIIGWQRFQRLCAAVAPREAFVDAVDAVLSGSVSPGSEPIDSNLAGETWDDRAAVMLHLLGQGLRELAA